MLRLLGKAPSLGPRVAVSTLFLILGLLAGTWISRIPAVTSNLDLDKGQIGSLLLLVAAGSLVAFQFIGREIERVGSARCSRLFGGLMIAGFSFVALAPNPASFGFALFTVGLAVGAAGVAMNAQGISVERSIGRTIMSSLHGFFSLGALVGSAFGGLMAHLEIAAILHFLGMSVLGLVILLWVGNRFVDDEPVADTVEAHTGLAIPPRALWPIGVIAFCAGFSEGSMFDWSALYIHDELGASEGIGALGFTLFSMTMLIGRFSGDKIVARVGEMAVIRAGGLIAALGMLGGLLMDTVAAAFAGFAILGLGISTLMPLVYSAAGSHPGVSSVRGVASIATMGFAGLLVGPPVLGTIAESTSLRAALGIVVLLCTVVAVLASSVKSASSPGDVESAPLLAGEQVA